MAAPQRPGPVQISAALKSAKDQISSKPGFIIASYDGPRSINLLHRGDDIRDLPRRVVPEQILWISLRLDTEVGSRRVFVGYFGPRYTGPIPLGHMPYIYKALGPADLVFTTHNESDLSADTILALMQSDPNDWAPPALLTAPAVSSTEQELQF